MSGCSEDPSELEVALAVANAIRHVSEPTEEDWEMAVTSATSNKPRCSYYARKIGTFVRLFGGGWDAPLIEQQSAFANTLSQTRVLGEELFTALLETKLDPIAQMVQVRHALMAANLTANKVIDGIARLLTLTDVRGLASKTKAASIAKAETVLGAASAVCDTLASGGHITTQQHMELLGLFRVRVGAFLCNKGKLTFEAFAYDTIDDICALFLKRVSECFDQNGVKQVPAQFPPELCGGLKAACIHLCVSHGRIRGGVSE